MDRNQEKEVLQKDTLVYDSIYLVYSGKPNIRPAVVTQKNYIIPGTLYDASDVNRTYRNLSSLSAFRMVDIRFREVEGETPLLDCDVMVAPATRQSYSVQAGRDQLRLGTLEQQPMSVTGTGTFLEARSNLT